MVAFMCLFFPAVLCVGLFEHLKKERCSPRGWLYRFCTSALFINGLCFLVKRFLLGTADAPFFTLYADTTPIAALNYLVLAIPGMILFAFLQVLLSKHATVTVEE